MKLDEELAQRLIGEMQGLKLRFIALEGKAVAALDDLKSAVDALATARDAEVAELQDVVSKLLAGPLGNDPQISEQVARLQAITDSMNKATQAAKDALTPTEVKVEATGTVTDGGAQ